MEDWQITIIDRAENVLKLRHRESYWQLVLRLHLLCRAGHFILHLFFRLFFFVLYGLYSSVYGLDFWTTLKVYIC